MSLFNKYMKNWLLLQVLKSMFGYEPYPGFDASTEAKMEGEIKKWQAKQEKKVT